MARPLAVLAWMFAAGLGVGWGCVQVQDAPPPVCTADASLTLYEKRIAPLLAEDRPKTCNECHLSGIDLTLFVRQTPCQTMACLQELGLVDLADPGASTILDWISRADPSSELIDDDVIRQEYDGFLEWIEYHAACDAEVCGSFEDPCAELTPESCEWSDDLSGKFQDPGDCSEFTIEALFRERVFRWRGRCFPCHFEAEDVLVDEAPKWIRDGPCDVASLESMREVEERGFLNLETPNQSLLLLKPLAEEAGGVEHGGHSKFSSIEEQAYRDFQAWIVRYAECRG